jgi:integrase
MQRQADPFQSDIGVLLEFFTDLFSVGLSYSAINTARSALSSILPFLDGKPIGEHPLIVRLCKGVRRSRPPKPRYSLTWDTVPVIQFIKGMHHTDLKDLTLKLVMLLALTTGQRAQTLHMLKLGNMTSAENSVTFNFSDPLKTKEPGTASVHLHRFTEEILLCPVTMLQCYLDRTADYRDNGSDQLFVATIKPHGPVSRDTIRRWIVLVMERAGIDTSIFKPHSTRAAATSAAFRKAVPIQSILKAAMWSSECTFAKFYNKPVNTPDSQFADSILKC